MPSVPAVAVKQWLTPEWDQATFEPSPPRGKPEPQFYLFSISAYDLKRLVGVYRRDPSKPPAEDMGIQRRHIKERSDEILRYLIDGFPLSRIDRRKLVDPNEAISLRMPGWLPTAVVVNILKETDKRGPKGRNVAADELVKIKYKAGAAHAEVFLPDKLKDQTWQPIIHPVEVIDGQHRLWALEEPADDEPAWSPDFRKKVREIDVPVVAFHGLDTTWQAYLFYTINQLPKKIDTSMVFDLYPLLRTEEWLLRFEGPNIYRETRAQDLTILLWSHPASPWKDRIIRLGGREKGKVTQAAFIRSLTASVIKRWQRGRGGIGGLYGAPLGSHDTQLNWGREQQAAFLIFAWNQLAESVRKSKAEWAKALVSKCMDAHSPQAEGRGAREQRCQELLFAGQDSLLATDQGVRAFSCVLNDLLWLACTGHQLELNAWDWNRKSRQDDIQAVTDALATIPLALPEAVKLVRKITSSLANFDWRASSAVRKDDPLYSRQASYRGSSGYREIRRNALLHLKENAQSEIGELAGEAIVALNFEPQEQETAED